MQIEIQWAPLHYRTIRRFTAPNPWNRGMRAEWTVSSYMIINEKLVTPDAAMTLKPNRLLRPELIGICSEPDKRYHLLPSALSELWKNNQVPDERLPELLKEMEPKLNDGDFWHPVKDLWTMLMMFLLVPLPLFFWVAYLFLRVGAADHAFFWVAGAFSLPAMAIIAFRLARLRRRQQQTSELLRRAAGVS